MLHGQFSKLFEKLFSWIMTLLIFRLFLLFNIWATPFQNKTVFLFINNIYFVNN